ncbi:MAG: 4-alpha-glucanotransferase [Patescibacteria group bacterium]|jgi:4-alpha-glucanotransferase
MKQRTAGILLHPTSLPSKYGIGDLGPEAYRFVDFLHAAGQKMWQVLPLTIPDKYGSPYASPSAFAGNWLLISREFLYEQKLLDKKYITRTLLVGDVLYGTVVAQKRQMLARSLEIFLERGAPGLRESFKRFCHQEQAWLDDFALFMALKKHFHNRFWHRWPKDIAQRRTRALTAWRKKLAKEIVFHQYTQWIFFEQWSALKKYANTRGVRIIGDLPFFVHDDSVDVWTHPNMFMLDTHFRPRFISGVPPDYFSARGQIWNDPQYNWDVIVKSNFRWWLQRFAAAERLYDIIRLDHFRGFAGVWHIRYGSLTARKGHWVSVPGRKLFAKVQRRFPSLRFIAEDLGYITRDVIELRKRFKFPGTRVMQFGFSGQPGNPHYVKIYGPNVVAYTGTHDNDTARGWIRDPRHTQEGRIALSYLKATKKNFSWKLIECGLRSGANTFITPVQDLLNLDSSARMNMPATKGKNWRWRMNEGSLTFALAKRLKHITKAARR